MGIDPIWQGRARALPLEATRGDAKVAIVSLLAGVSADEARLRLKAAGSNVRRSLEAR